MQMELNEIKDRPSAKYDMNHSHRERGAVNRIMKNRKTFHRKFKPTRGEHHITREVDQAIRDV